MSAATSAATALPLKIWTYKVLTGSKKKGNVTLIDFKAKTLVEADEMAKKHKAEHSELKDSLLWFSGHVVTVQEQAEQ